MISFGVPAGRDQTVPGGGVEAFDAELHRRSANFRQQCGGASAVVDKAKGAAHLVRFDQPEFHRWARGGRTSSGTCPRHGTSLQAPAPHLCMEHGPMLILALGLEQLLQQGAPRPAPNPDEAKFNCPGLAFRQPQSIHPIEFGPAPKGSPPGLFGLGVADQRDRHENPFRGVVGEAFVERRVGGEDAVVAHQQRVAVVRCVARACSALQCCRAGGPGRFSMMKG